VVFEGFCSFFLGVGKMVGSSVLFVLWWAVWVRNIFRYYDGSVSVLMLVVLLVVGIEIKF